MNETHLPRPRLVRFIDCLDDGDSIRWGYGVFIGSHLACRIAVKNDGVTPVAIEADPHGINRYYERGVLYAQMVIPYLSNLGFTLSDDFKGFVQDYELDAGFWDTENDIRMMRRSEINSLRDRFYEWKGMSTFVYLMQDVATGYTKIGMSKRPKVRESTLFSEKPSIDLIDAWRAMPQEERELHERFKDRRIRGEWFALADGDIQDIRQFFAGREVYA